MDKEVLKSEIERLRSEKNAVIMAHYYQIDEIQEIADFVGDSLALAQQAAKTEADIIVLCGVHFMAETAKIISPEKKVLIPDAEAGCSLADSCPADEFEAFVKAHPDHTVISYVNTSAAVKALTDIVVTSSNALQIINSLPKDEKIIFGPDRNLGNYIKSLSGRDMLIWDGACHVHEQFSLQKILELKKQHPQAEIIAHPECKQVLLSVSDFIGSTSALIAYVQKAGAEEFIVATEPGVLFEMSRKSPAKKFIPAPPDDASCACNECAFMRMHTLEKLYLCLRNEQPEVLVEEHLRRQALKSIQRMLEISASIK
ncbi:MAG: quinolinate synthase NadA [Bacteroidales bacterium]|nr:quinolinate synthase NadA [Bacteroidales bacterium]MDD3430944.1 quinolinate synthase NadA [Bacteroidales bacterium]MDD4362037.1 quinolinate synthase NadA [Bacteroidales bacterium]MDD4429914.1 quinolinate synthase NadA [Bacteroidales bacterium]